MGNLLIFIGQPKQAIVQLKDAIRLNPFHENWYLEYLGWAYEEAGMPNDAIGVLEQVVDKVPSKEDSWVLPTLAAAYAHPTVGRMDDAHQTVKTILSLEPDFTISDFVSRYPYRSKEQVDRFVTALRRAGLPE
jgi:adenylate cyclase